MNSCFQACLKICPTCSGVTAQKSHQMPQNFTALKFSPIMPSAGLPHTTFSALPSRLSGGSVPPTISSAMGYVRMWQPPRSEVA